MNLTKEQEEYLFFEKALNALENGGFDPFCINPGVDLYETDEESKPEFIHRDCIRHLNGRETKTEIFRMMKQYEVMLGLVPWIYSQEFMLTLKRMKYCNLIINAENSFLKSKGYGIPEIRSIAARMTNGISSSVVWSEQIEPNQSWKLPPVLWWQSPKEGREASLMHSKVFIFGNVENDVFRPFEYVLGSVNASAQAFERNHEAAMLISDRHLAKEAVDKFWLPVLVDAEEIPFPKNLAVQRYAV